MEAKKKRKNYFSNHGNDHKRRKRLSLECGMRGFLCTCNFREKDCVREAYNLLEEFADKICVSDEKQSHIVATETKLDASEQRKEVKKEEENKTESEIKELVSKEDEENQTKWEEKELQSKEFEEHETKSEEKELASKESEEKETKSEEKELPSKESRENTKESEEHTEETEANNIGKDEDNNDNEDSDDDEDISTALNKEINELKAEAAKPMSQKKFQVVDTGVSNVVFIKTTVPDPLELVTAVVKDLHETKKQKSRYLLRLLPIPVVCKAYIEDIRAKADPLLEKYFAQEPKTFAIVFNRHSNNSLHRNDVIEDLAKIILKKNPGNKANLKNPDIAVVVEVIRAVCLISIAPQYFMYKKYNLLEICNQK